MKYTLLFVFFTSLFSVLKDKDDLNTVYKTISWYFSVISLIITSIPMVPMIINLIKNPIPEIISGLFELYNNFLDKNMVEEFNIVKPIIDDLKETFYECLDSPNFMFILDNIYIRLIREKMKIGCGIEGKVSSLNWRSNCVFISNVNPKELYTEKDRKTIVEDHKKRLNKNKNDYVKPNLLNYYPDNVANLKKHILNYIEFNRIELNSMNVVINIDDLKNFYSEEMLTNKCVKSIIINWEKNVLDAYVVEKDVELNNWFEHDLNSEETLFINMGKKFDYYSVKVKKEYSFKFIDMFINNHLKKLFNGTITGSNILVKSNNPFFKKFMYHNIDYVQLYYYFVKDNDIDFITNNLIKDIDENVDSLQELENYKKIGTKYTIINDEKIINDFGIVKTIEIGNLNKIYNFDKIKNNRLKYYWAFFKNSFNRKLCVGNYFTMDYEKILKLKKFMKDENFDYNILNKNKNNIFIN